MELDFYMLRTVLISMLDRRVQIKNEEECYSKPMRNKVRSEEEKETREEVSLNDFPKLVEDFYKVRVASSQTLFIDLILSC